MNSTEAILLTVQFFFTLTDNKYHSNRTSKDPNSSINIVLQKKSDLSFIPTDTRPRGKNQNLSMRTPPKRNLTPSTRIVTDLSKKLTETDRNENESELIDLPIQVKIKNNKIQKILARK